MVNKRSGVPPHLFWVACAGLRPLVSGGIGGTSRPILLRRARSPCRRLRREYLARGNCKGPARAPPDETVRLGMVSRAGRGDLLLAVIGTPPCTAKSAWMDEVNQRLKRCSFQNTPAGGAVDFTRAAAGSEDAAAPSAVARCHCRRPPVPATSAISGHKGLESLDVTPRWLETRRDAICASERQPRRGPRPACP
jgi:hypothetical protein